MSEFEKEFEQSFEEPKVSIDPDSNFVKINQLAYLTASYLVQNTINLGKQFVETDFLPVIKLIMFKSFINGEDSPEFDPRTVQVNFDEIISTGEYRTIKDNPLFEVYSEMTDAFIQTARHNMDNGQQLLGILRVLVSEVLEFERELKETKGVDFVTLLQGFVGKFTESAINMQKVIESTMS